MVSYCAGCNGKIHDKFLMKVLDKTWHSECLVCVECGAALAEQCFTRNGKFYCKKDFEKNQVSVCGSCKKDITPDDLILKPPSTGGVFHVSCFTCSKCFRQLEAGEEFYTIGDNKFLCSRDYKVMRSKPPLTSDNEVHSTTSEMSPVLHPGHCAPVTTMGAEYHGPHPAWASPSSLSPPQLSPPRHSPHGVVSTTVQDTLSPNSSHMKQGQLELGDISKGKLEHHQDQTVLENANSPETSNSQVSTTTGKRRGPRTTIKSKQLDILKAAFKSNQKPTRNIREQLASETGLNMRVIQVWFQNRRSKERRLTQMKLANRGRYGNPLVREEDFAFQEHYYRSQADCYYPEMGHHAHHHPDPGYLPCLPLGMEPGPRSALDHHDPWARSYSEHHQPSPGGLLGAGYPGATGPWQSAVSPEATNPIAFQT